MRVDAFVSDHFDRERFPGAQCIKGGCTKPAAWDVMMIGHRYRRWVCSDHRRWAKQDMRDLVQAARQPSGEADTHA